MKYICGYLKKLKLIFSCFAYFFSSCTLYASAVLSINELKKPQTYASNFQKVLESARQSPPLFISPYQKAPLIFHIIGGGVVQAEQAKELIDIILEAGIQINSIKSIDGRSMLHAIVLCPLKYPAYIEEMVCFLLERGINSEMKDKAGFKAEDYLLRKSIKLYLLVKKAVTKNQSNSSLDAPKNKEQESGEKKEPITPEKVVQALMQVFYRKDLISLTQRHRAIAKD